MFVCVCACACGYSMSIACYCIAETLVFQTVSEILLMAWYVHAKHIRTPHGRFYAACWHHYLRKGPKPIFSTSNINVTLALKLNVPYSSVTDSLILSV